ncbi:MAG: chitobiase/beta-hexosaminidase C-terminal domain-containing protein, partial [Oscillospiraceae bacterium]
MKNKFWAAVVSAVLAVGAFSTPVQSFIGASVTAQAASSVAAPTCSKSSGSYYQSGSMKVTLSCSTKGATIYYSVNGAAYKRYTKAIYISKNSTLKFYASKSGVKSKTVTRKYTLLPKFTITPSAGTYEGTQTIKLTSSLSGLKFYYTLDGSKPTTSSALYTAKGITIDKDCTLRIRTAKSGWSARYVTKNYTITSGKEDSEPVIITEEGSILEEYENKYCYSTLTAKQKQLYTLIYEGAAAHKAEIDVQSLGCNSADLELAFYAMDYDNPQFFWLDSGYSYTYISNTIYTVKPMYSRTAKEAAAIAPKLEAGAQAIINEALKKDDLFERVLFIHDSIVNRTTYTLNGDEYIRDADGVILNGKALCEGYSKTFAYLCQSVGIECFCVSGDAGGPHMWNMVKLDGNWYNMDVTFDDPVGATPTCEYNYFCLSDAQIAPTHTKDA